MKNWAAIRRRSHRIEEAKGQLPEKRKSTDTSGGGIGELRTEDGVVGIGVWDPVKGIVMPSGEPSSSKPQGPPLRIGKWVATNSAEWTAKHGGSVGILANDQINVEVGDLTMQGITRPVVNGGGRVHIKKGGIDASAPSEAASTPSPRSRG
jgi:hypothetical protein